MSKLAKIKGKKIRTQNRKTSFLTECSLSFLFGNCYVMSMSKVRTSLLLCKRCCVYVYRKTEKLAENRVEPVFGLNRIAIKRRVAPQTAG